MPERLLPAPNDALYDQIKDLRDEHGKPVTPIVFHAWVDKYGRALLQKHLRVGAFQIRGRVAIKLAA